MLKNEKKLWIAFFLTTIFIVIEILGSLASKSLALLSDAAHLFTDAAALIISLTAMQLAKRSADKKRTFGYYRFEILAAAFNASVLFLVAFYIFYEAYQRFSIPNTVQTTGMLWVAAGGMIINLISVLLLQSASEESLNIKSAYLDAQADLISSFGVIITACLIRITQWQHLDSIMAIIIAIWILPRAWKLLKESINILLEGVPEGIELAEIYEALLELPSVRDVHDLHVWALTNRKISLTAHLVIDEANNSEVSLLQSSTLLLKERFNITHTTIQIENFKCEAKAITH